MQQLAARHSSIFATPIISDCLDSQRVEANEAYCNTSHTIPGSSFTGRPQATQQAFQSIKDTKRSILRNAQAVAQRHGTEPYHPRPIRTELKNRGKLSFQKCLENDV